MMATVATIVSSVGLVISLVLLSWQGREIARQSQINNGIAAASAICSTFDQLHDVQSKLLDWPELFPYFYEGKQCPSSGPERVRALMVAEMMADALDCGIKCTTLFPSTETYDDWIAYAKFLADRSPIMVEVITGHSPVWWPQLVSLFRGSALLVHEDKSIC